MSKIGQTGTITWGNGTTSKVIISHIDTYSCLPTDYWLSYAEGETNRPIVHPDFGKLDLIKTELVLPEGLMDMSFAPDVN